MPDTILINAEEKMEKTIESLKREFINIRTGKANPAVLNNIMVDYYGQPTPIPHVGSVSAPDPQCIVVKPWDKSLLKEICRAIQTSDLGLNPQQEADIVRIPVPPLTEEVRRDLVKHAKKIAEDNKVAIRNVRRDANDALKKLENDSVISEDELEIYNEEVQSLTDKYISEIDSLVKAKEQDIMNI